MVRRTSASSTSRTGRLPSGESTLDETGEEIGARVGATEDEVMKKTAEHAKSAHGMHHLAPETALTLRAAIREEQPAV